MRTVWCLALIGLSLVLAPEEAQAQRRGGRNRTDRGPAEGKAAPDFELVQLDKEGNEQENAEKVRLSSFQGDKPVALIFGSYT